MPMFPDLNGEENNRLAVSVDDYIAYDSSSSGHRCRACGHPANGGRISRRDLIRHIEVLKNERILEYVFLIIYIS